MAGRNPCRREDKHSLHVAHDTWAYKRPAKLLWLLRLAALRLVKRPTSTPATLGRVSAPTWLMIGVTAAVEVVAACSFEDGELVVASTAKGTIAGATDDEGVGTARSWAMGQPGAPMMPSRLPSTWKLVSCSQAAGVLNP